MIDDWLCLRVGRGDIDAAPALRRDTRDDNANASMELVRLIRSQHGKDVQIEVSVLRLR